MTGTILEIPEVRQRISLLSVAEYHRLGEFNEKGRRTELIRGLVIEKMSKSPLHSTIVALLYQLLLARVPTGFLVRQEQPLTFQDSEPEPDLAIVPGTAHDYLKAHPTTAELVIEVSLGNPALDRENASLYAEANVKEYWIVLGAERQVEVHRQAKNGTYQDRFVTGTSDVVRSSTLPEIYLQIAKLI